MECVRTHAKQCLHASCQALGLSPTSADRWLSWRYSTGSIVANMMSPTPSRAIETHTSNVTQYDVGSWLGTIEMHGGLHCMHGKLQLHPHQLPLKKAQAPLNQRHLSTGIFLGVGCGLGFS